MKTQDFISLLEKHPGKEMRFAYLEDQFVDTNYHLTEVKNVNFDTTDCGGKTNQWEETHMQLWESPEEKGKSSYMTTDKILAIIERVNQINPLLLETELKFEYGNQGFNTGVMPVKGVQTNQQFLDILLFEETARCKANELCGIIEEKVMVAEHAKSEEQDSCCSSTNCC